MEQAAAFYTLNRASFSGTTLSGGMSPGHPRFTQSAIDRLRSFRASNFSVACCDYRRAICRHSDAFLYLDPPYLLVRQALYGVKWNTHSGFNHEALAKLLNSRGRWILSYNDCSIIRELYSGKHILSVSWKYGMSRDKASNEILIFSEKPKEEDRGNEGALKWRTSSSIKWW